LIVHGEQDSLVPLENAREIYQHLGPRKKDSSSSLPLPTMTSCGLGLRIISKPFKNLLRDRAESEKGNKEERDARLFFERRTIV